jgi:hypothetical protein
MSGRRKSRATNDLFFCGAKVYELKTGAGLSRYHDGYF